MLPHALGLKGLRDLISCVLVTRYGKPTSLGAGALGPQMSSRSSNTPLAILCVLVTRCNKPTSLGAGETEELHQAEVVPGNNNSVIEVHIGGVDVAQVRILVPQTGHLGER